ncbi:MAG TPA: hypothetical protein VFZ00_27255 [Solirubrobacter sp.]|nr:hypothetical protein [Solirubrobacter sp.]
MPTLVVGGTEIPLAQDGLSETPEEIGERVRMFDASMLEAIRARKTTRDCLTTLVPRATAESYRAALLASPPISCTGDAFNNVPTNCFAKVKALTPVKTQSGLRWRLAFTLFEA